MLKNNFSNKKTLDLCGNLFSRLELEPGSKDCNEETLEVKEIHASELEKYRWVMQNMQPFIVHLSLWACSQKQFPLVCWKNN